LLKKKTHTNSIDLPCIPGYIIFMSNKPLSYADSGVNIDEGNALVDQIENLVKPTLRPEVMAAVGGYAGLFALDTKKYKNPVLVSCTDGVGTKLKLAFEMNRFDTIGQDLAAMCVNDLVCCAAEPLFFLDYYATGKLDSKIAAPFLKGLSKALSEINCTLIGGETAEMPGFYKPGEFDVAGFSVGVVEKNKIIDGKNIKEEDLLIGIASSGFHSNGYSLVRKIVETSKLKLTEDALRLGKPLGEILLEPTRIYVKPILKLLSTLELKGIAHITGGGLIENLPRIFGEKFSAKLTVSQINPPRLFREFQKLGKVAEHEMWRVFNMGIGMAIVLAPSDAPKTLEILTQQGYPSCVIGKMVARKKINEEVILI